MALFVLILKKALIYSSREWFGAEVRFHSFVNDGSLSLPELDDLQATHDQKQKRALVRNAAQNVMGHWDSVTIQHIGDRHTFKFGDTGRILLRADHIPETLDWVMLAIESDRDIRDLAGDVDHILSDQDADAIATGLMTILSVAASPTTAAATFLAKKLLRSVTYFMGKNEDDQLGVIEQSFIRPLHYPDGKRDGIAVSDLSGNLWYDYQIFGSADI